MKPDTATALAQFRARMGDPAWGVCLELLEFLELDIQEGLAAKPREEAVFLREQVLALRRARRLMQGGSMEKQEHIYST